MTPAGSNKIRTFVFIGGCPNSARVEAGTGPTVILLHGVGGSSVVWNFNIGPLAEKYKPKSVRMAALLKSLAE